MPLTDHVLLLQQERALEALSDRVVDVEKDVNHDFCDCNCAESEMDDISGDLTRAEERITTLETHLSEAVDLLTTLTERFAELESNHDALVAAIRGGAGRRV